MNSIMTIEEKAKAYDEAIERAKKMFSDKEIDYLFPDLKKNDGDLKLTIIQFLEYASSYGCPDILSKEKAKTWIAWLEKQGDINRRIQEEIEKQTKQQWKSKKQGVNVSGECNDTALEEQLKIWFEKGKCSGIDDVIFHPQKYGLEKQSESDETKAKTFLINKGYPIDTNSVFPTYEEMYNIIREGLEKQSEPIDKIEPKFKVGDWVVNHNVVYHIDKISGVYLTLSTLDGIALVYHISVLDSEYTHLWTIEDAGDGDILACGDKVIDCSFIFHNLNKELNPRSYCGVNTLRHFQDNDENGGCWCYSNEVRPATKEQRDFLFQKMKKAGYEWDAEKKELKKIHVIDEGKAEIDYCFTKMMNGEKVSSAWSREDEQKLNAALSYINDESICRWL